jgi:hypothetical protein
VWKCRFADWRLTLKRQRHLPKCQTFQLFFGSEEKKQKNHKALSVRYLVMPHLNLSVRYAAPPTRQPKQRQTLSSFVFLQPSHSGVSTQQLQYTKPKTFGERLHSDTPPSFTFFFRAGQHTSEASARAKTSKTM